VAGNRYAIVIGVSHYEIVPELRYGDKDARDIGEALRLAGFDEDKTILLQDEDPVARPTRGRVFHELGRLSRFNLDPDDLVLFYFSGHGMMAEGIDYLLPLDASDLALEDTALAVETAFGYLRKSGSREVIALVDACRDEMPTGKGVYSIGANAKSVIDRADDGLAAIFSCEDNERSFEIDSGDIKQSSFTYCLLQAIHSPEVRTLGQTADYLRREVMSLNGKSGLRPQRPYLHPNPNALFDLTLFSAHGGIRTLASEFMAGVTNLYGQKLLDDLIYYDVMEFLYLEQNQQDPGRVRLVEDVCNGVTTAEKFARYWKALRSGVPKRIEPSAVGRPGAPPDPGPARG
jgi:hypothetical protein